MSTSPGHAQTFFWPVSNRPVCRPNFARTGAAPADPELVNQVPEFYPQPGNPPQGWGFGGFLTIEAGPTGRGKNTLWWMGLPNCFWWIDRERGVAGFLGSQVRSLVDRKKTTPELTTDTGASEWGSQGDSGLVLG